MTTERTPKGTSACAGCPLDTSRREFMERMLGLSLGAFAGLGPGSPMRLAAVRPVLRSGDELTYDIPSQDGAQIDHHNQVILVRWDGAVYAFNLSCPHQNTALRWVAKDARFRCPKHKSMYEPNGTFLSGRATRSMDRFSLHRDGNTVVVDLDALYRQDKDPAGWAAAVLEL